ncbi:leptin receptor isoform X2 [Paroedura picta]|uniref:leptin receptor isoform X2 n=1 Tax=Paroedura picta TaxID=143630 RepID=UPI004057795C
MSWHNILIRFLQLNFLQVVISYRMVYQIPPQSFQLPCEPTGKRSSFPFPVAIAENSLSSNEEPDPTETNATALVAEDNFLCCHWTDTYVNCFIYAAEMETKTFTEQTDSIWNLQFWTAVSSEELLCVVGLSSKSSYLTEDFTINLLYTLTDVSLESNSTNSLKNNFTVVQCTAVKHQKYQCQIPSVRLNHTYIMWLKITHGMALLQSPLMSLMPVDMVKPESPLNVKIEMTDKGKLKISWSNPSSTSHPLQYEVKYFANASKNVYQAVEIAMETSLILSHTLLDSSYVFQVRCKSIYGPGLWSDWSLPFNFNLQDVMYFPPKILASVGTNVSFYCIYKNKNKIISSKKIVWWLNLVKEVPRSQYTLVNDFVGKVTLINLDAMKPGGNFLFNALYCCNENKECNHRYAELYIIDVNINITCETHGNLQKMTCKWSTSTDLLLSESTLLLRYYRSDIYCSESSSMPADSEVKECHTLRNNSYECIFQPFYLLSGYTMWIEIKHPLGTLTSQPVCILPKEVVKPFPPFSVQAEITREIGMLNVSWKNPELPKSDLQFQIRYGLSGTEVTWEMHAVSAVSECCASIEVQDPCALYIVQVRCSVLGGAGYWSDWSRPAYTAVKDIKAPLRGPEFWRIVNEDPVQKQKNVTLFWKPLEKNLALCSVLDYVIEHTTSENITWSDYIENDTTYTFPWTEDVHSVKVIAVNSVGASTVNFIITLSQQMDTVNIVKSLSVYPINSSCVIVSWMLSPSIYIVTSFVIEWTNLHEEQIKWIMVPSHIRKCHIYDNFFLIEKYRFSVYPIISEGITKPTVTEIFSKGGIEKQNHMNIYMIFLLVIMCLIFLIAALLILHQRMKTLLWDDVPNPKKCSWAQSVNFQKKVDIL